MSLQGRESLDAGIVRGVERKHYSPRSLSEEKALKFARTYDIRDHRRPENLHIRLGGGGEAFQLPVLF